MPKIYIFHKLLQGKLKCYGLIVVPNIFGQLKLTSPLWRLSNSPPPPHTLTHTHCGKTNCRKCKRSLVPLGHTPFFLLPPSSCTRVFTDLQNLNEIYIRKLPRRRCTRNPSTEQISMCYLTGYIPFIYKVSKLVR